MPVLSKLKYPIGENEETRCYHGSTMYKLLRNEDYMSNHNHPYNDIVVDWLQLQDSIEWEAIDNKFKWGEVPETTKAFYQKHAKSMGDNELAKFAFAAAADMYIGLHHDGGVDGMSKTHARLIDLIRLGWLVEAYPDSEDCIRYLTGWYLIDIIFLKKRAGANGKKLKKFLMRLHLLNTKRGVLDSVARHTPCMCMEKYKSTVPKESFCVACKRYYPLEEKSYMCACHCVEYCSMSCQTNDWARHKHGCKYVQRLLGSKQATPVAPPQTFDTLTWAAPLKLFKPAFRAARHVIFSNTGYADDLNGLYERVGSLEGGTEDFWYSKYRTPETKYCLHRCTKSNNTQYWYISIVRTRGALYVNDLYYAPVTAEPKFNPPPSGWRCCVKGIYPPPTITLL